MNERETAGASYLITFYQDCQNLTAKYAEYENILLELENKHPDGKFDQQERQTLNDTLQQIRYYTHTTYITYTSLTATTKKNPNQKITENYQQIRTNYVIDRDTLQNYVQQLNHYLLSEIIQSLLKNSQQIISKIYENENNKA